MRRLSTIESRLWGATILLLFGLFVLRFAVDPLGISLDCAINLEYASLVLDGRVPYVGFVDTNPPLIFYLNIPPVALARLLGANPIPVFSWFVLGLVVLSSYGVWRVLAPLGERLGSSRTLHLVATWLCVSLFLLYTGHFGQREHLAALTYFPFFFYRWRKWEFGVTRRKEAVSLGWAAGVGLALKPYFLLFALLPELYWLARKRSLGALLGPETCALAVASAANAGLLLLLPPEARDAFFGRWLPLLLAKYGAYDASTGDLLRLALPSAVALAVALALCGLCRAGALRTLGVPLALVAAGGLLGFLAQRKGYSYHIITANAAVLVLASVAARGIADRVIALESTRRFGPLVTITPALGVLVSVVLLSGYSGVRYYKRASAGTLDSSATPVAEFVASTTGPGDPVLVLSTSVYPAYPTLLQTGRRPASRYLYLFPIPLVFFDSQLGPGHRMSRPYEATDPAEERRVLAELEQDIARHRPRLVLVDHTGGCQGCPRKFDLYTYLERRGFFSTAMRGYRIAGEVDGYVAFQPEAPRDAASEARIPERLPAETDEGSSARGGAMTILLDRKSA